MVMVPACNNDFWYILLYCVLLWGFLVLALLAADPLHRWKESLAGAAVELILISTLSTLSGFAIIQLQTGYLMAVIFQLVGVIISAMAVSRVFQLLTWRRTLLAAVYSLVAYLLTGLILSELLIGSVL